MSSQPKGLPYTKDGYRYSWGDDDVGLCRAYIEELSKLDKEKKKYNAPSFVKRKIISETVKLSESDKAPQLKLEKEVINDDETMKELVLTGEKGYSMVRATHGVNRGKFYYELNVISMPENTAARIGWGQCYTNLQAPLGYDSYGYSFRSRCGTKFHKAQGCTFDKGGGYGTGDTIGCMIELPPLGNNPSRIYLPKSVKMGSFILRSKKGVKESILEERDDPPTLKPHIGSKISFYKNGHFIGVAYENIWSGFYYPSISLYKSCKITVNFGPDFKYPPEKFNDNSKNHLFYRPACEMAQVCIIDHMLSDLVYVVEQEADEPLESKPTINGSDNQQESISTNTGGRKMRGKLREALEKCISGP